MIVTQCVNPPVPTRQWDWVAYIEGDEEANGPTGRGPTEAEALRDLCERLVMTRDGLADATKRLLADLATPEDGSQANLIADCRAALRSAA